LQEAAQFVQKEDLINQSSSSDSDEASEKVKIRKYPFITDHKQWKKK